MKKINLAFIGAGKTMEEYLKVITSINQNLKLVGIYSRTFKKAEYLKKKYKILNNFDSISDLYEKTKPDIVIVVISAENVKKEIKKISQYDWKIFIEKPFGINYEETIKIKKIIKSKIDDVFIALNRLYFSSTINLLNNLKNDKSKRVINIFDQEKYYSNKLLSKNLMYTNSIHLFTYCPILARGKLLKIKQILSQKKHIIKKMVFSSGDIIIFHSIWNKPGPWRVEINTNNSYFLLNPLEKLFIKKNKTNKFDEFKLSENDKNYKTGFKLQLLEYLKLYNSNVKKYNFEFYLLIIKIIKKYYKY
jgi:hypothetical protein